MTIEVDLPLTGGRSLHAALAEPTAGSSNGAGVLVVHEALGLTDDMRRMATRFADHGYTALAPDFLGAGWKPLCIARFMQGIARVGTGRPYRELAAAQQWLGRRESVDPARIGVRVPELAPAVAELADAVGGLALTSANRRGEPAPGRLSDVPSELLAVAAVVVDGGPLPGIASTIIDITGPEPVVLRPGRARIV